MIRNSTGNLGSLEHWERGSVLTVTVITPDLEGVSSGFNIKADLSETTSRTFLTTYHFQKRTLLKKHMLYRDILKTIKL